MEKIARYVRALWPNSDENQGPVIFPVTTSYEVVFIYTLVYGVLLETLVE